MAEQGQEELNRDEIALSRFKEVLPLIGTPNGEFFRNLVDRGLVRLVTDEQTFHKLKGDRKSGGVGWFAQFNGAEKTVRVMVGIDSERFVTRGLRSLEGSVRDALEKFGHVISIAQNKSLEWRYLEDAEVDNFLVELSSGGGQGYIVVDIPNTG